MSMKHVAFAIVALWVLSGLAVCYAIEPAHEGRLGNPEEPALRPYKWAWHGMKALGYHTWRTFKRGNIRTPVLGTVEVCRGVRRGTVELGESTARGSLFTPMPAKGSYKKFGVLNQKIEDEWLIQALCDLGFSGPAYPVLVAHDHNPLRSEADVNDVEDAAREKREARREGRQPQPEDQTRVSHAMREYIGVRASYGKAEKKHTEKKRIRGARGNLMRLAK